MLLFPVLTFLFAWICCCSGVDRDGDAWSGDSDHGTDMFSDWHHQLHEQMEEMDKQMREVFRIFRFPDMPSGMNIRSQYIRNICANYAWNCLSFSFCKATAGAG